MQINSQIIRKLGIKPVLFDVLRCNCYRVNFLKYRLQLNANLTMWILQRTFRPYGFDDSIISFNILKPFFIDDSNYPESIADVFFTLRVNVMLDLSN